MRTIAKYEGITRDRYNRTTWEQAQEHAQDLRSYGFRASVTTRDRVDGSTVYIVRSNIPADDWRA